MVFAFSASWLWSVLFNVLRDYDRLPEWMKEQEYFYGIATHCIAMTSTQRAAVRRRQRTNRMLISMVFAFSASWLWSVLFNVLRDYDRLPEWMKKQEYFYGIATHCIAMTSTVWNPLLYALLNPQLRAAFIRLMPTCLSSKNGVDRYGQLMRNGTLLETGNDCPDSCSKQAEQHHHSVRQAISCAPRQYGATEHEINLRPKASANVVVHLAGIDDGYFSKKHEQCSLRSLVQKLSTKGEHSSPVNVRRHSQQYEILSNSSSTSTPLAISELFTQYTNPIRYHFVRSATRPNCNRVSSSQAIRKCSY
ncbi:hypothetical protein Tcan_18880 [Toxocara canis]|uniref:G-protein coupled receptors family 1 profile domain-containing protein n=1 Tax=Toxocara canis TaxID=6265 RepID=A0A0B2VBF9_TOXCA|nr:hypothetical protein Tcan_18880 [Toxocara canis]